MKFTLLLIASLAFTMTIALDADVDLSSLGISDTHAAKVIEFLADSPTVEQIREKTKPEIIALAETLLPDNVPEGVASQMFKRIISRPVTPADYAQYIADCTEDYEKVDIRTQGKCYREMTTCVNDNDITTRDQLWTCLEDIIANHTYEDTSS